MLMTLNRHVTGHQRSTCQMVMVPSQVYHICELRVDFGGIFGTNLCSSTISMEEQHKVHTSLQQFVTDETLRHLPQLVLFKMQSLSSQYTINSGMAMIIDL